MEKLIAEITKNAREKVRVELSEYRGHDLISIRVWWLDGNSDTWRPSKKGLALSIDQLPELMDALAKARTEAEKAGLLESQEAA
ncbi:MAG: transcriptional coactivator p15/PC4 family protein [Proteobacteria bacterium]|nr:transcriptional coactivator p15/PC4 family protein [Pseudomonadota bacterium]MBU1742746.1 transcriptional coactivator p15/PC4 family protein [Pseudomonadota bacterium]